MPKMKSHSGAKKRFSKTATGKWKHRKTGRRHLLTPMSSKTGRNLRRSNILETESSESKLLKKYLPYE